MNEIRLNVTRSQWKIVGLLLLLIFPMADVMAVDNQPSAVISAFSWDYIARLVLTLAAVLGCFLLCAWMLRRSNLPIRAQNKNLSVVASVSIGSRERLMVVQAGKKQVLLGITPTQINSLTVLDEPLTPLEQKDDTTFRTVLDNFVGKSSIKR